MPVSHAAYDIIVIGAGPAGLSAARTAAGLGLRTLVLERLPRVGELGHPCGGAIAPVPGFVSGQRRDDGLHFLELDLVIPSSLIVGSPTIQRYVSPGGREFRVAFPNRDDFPVAVIDKPALLRLMAEQAKAAGAKLQFGTSVTGLLEEAERIAGVRTRGGEIRARAVLSAEGISRRLCIEAGLYRGLPPATRYAFIVNADFEAPAVHTEHLAQIATFGQRYTSAPQGFGTVLLPAPGRASVYFAILRDKAKAHANKSLWFYLDEYIREDPRVRGFFAGARAVRRAGCRLEIRVVPPHVVRDGFLGVGDAVTPGGHLGILPSMYLGQQAARVVAEAVRAGDTSAERLAPYDRLFHGPILRGLETEGKIMMGLAGMTDDEIDRVCQTLSRLNLIPFFFGDWRPILWESLRWVTRGLPLILRDWRLLQHMLR